MSTFRCYTPAMNFTAIDFETATFSRNSACAVGIVTVENSQITDTYYTLIRPPENQYYWQTIQVHGIHPHQTENEKSFQEIFDDELRPRLQNRTLVAHNAPFDRSVLESCMRSASLDPPSLNISTHWECTLKIYRQKGHNPCALSDCCSALNIDLDHHQALSDALACAQLYLRHSSIRRP